MPFCMNCGTKLPDGAKFCFKCGTKVWKEEEGPGEKAPQKQDITPAKSKSMVAVPGKGVYFHKESNLYVLPEGESAVKKLTHYRGGFNTRYLNYYDGKLYYMFYRYHEDSGTEEFSMAWCDPETGETGTLKKQIPWAEEHSFCTIKDGALYYIAERSLNEFIRLDLTSGEVERRPMPDLREKPLPAEWTNQKDSEDGPLLRQDNVERKNYGYGWLGLYIHGEYAYASLGGGMAYFAVRFPLNDPQSYEYLPFGTVLAVANSTGEDWMIDIYRDMLVCAPISYWNRDPILCGTLIGERVAGTPKELVRFDKVGMGDIDAGCGWFRVGSRYFLNDKSCSCMYDMETGTADKLPFYLIAQDFAERGNGEVLVCEYGYYYLLPDRFWEKIKSRADLEKYSVWLRD